MTYPSRRQRASSRGLNLDYSQQFSRTAVAVLQRHRKALGISQEKLAELTGLSRSAITMIESGKRNPTLFVCHAVAGALGVSLSEVICDAEEQEDKVSGRRRKS